jgi:two-component system, NtrC family, sensor kinase
MSTQSTSIAPPRLRQTIREGLQLSLRWRIVSILLLVSLLPLALLGIGAQVVFSRLLINRAIDQQYRLAARHAASIESFLDERLRALELMTRSYTFTDLRQQETLEKVLVAFNSSYSRAFSDLGVIDQEGRHVAYVGPYDLLKKNYSKMPWFRIVQEKRSYISDVFLGFRQVPHCIIAILRREDHHSWILRATINSQSFEKLVAMRTSRTWIDSFIINSEGYLQTPSARMRILSHYAHGVPVKSTRQQESRVVIDGRKVIQVVTWINQGRWMLVMHQDEAEIQAPINQTMIWGGLVSLLAVGLIVVTTILATWYLTARIDHATAQRDKLQRDLLRSAKLASLGELASGLAHEINNPLGIISAEQTNILDQLGDLQLSSSLYAQLQKSVERVKRQVTRCSGITAKMLQFGRKGEAQLSPTEVAPLLQETIQLLKRQALARNIDLQLEIEPDLPLVILDGNELEQVMVNLISNAIYAINVQGAIWITACREGGDVVISVRDTGCGILPEHQEQIFEPFFTTKPAGQGTGLGLAVCCGIVRSWGGKMTVESVVDVGTELAIHLQIPPGWEKVAVMSEEEAMVASKGSKG